MADDADQPEGVMIDRSGDTPVRKDSRGVLHMLRDELNKHFPHATDVKVNNGGKPQGLMDAVDEAVKGAPASGSQEY